MQKGNVKLTRRHAGGMVKIHDRKYELDEKGREKLDEKGEKTIVPFSHRLSRDAYGKSFTVNDVEFVMKRHGAILERA